jgi:NAD(P)-dependent dehydrogenase (short-subunit alcohol dehydrogenase family)/acyl carrier protein
LRRIAAIRELEAMGATVMAAAVDIADEAQVRKFVDEFAEAGYPPIRGVIHSAGLVDDRLLLQTDRDSFRQVTRPKVHGAWNLHRAFANAPLDFFVLYSSVGSILAATGQANYAAGNAFLDACAHHRRNQGLPALSINWGPWATGMVADLNLAGHFASRGIDVITPDQGMRFLGHLMARNTAQVMVLSADWRKLFEYQPKVAPMLAHLADESESSGPSGSRNATADFLETLLIAEPAEQDALMTDHIQSLAARVFRMDREKIDVSESFSAFGLDSMMAMELKGRIELTLRVPVSVLELLNGVGIGDLSKSLLAKVRDQHSEIIQMLDGLSEEPAAPLQESSLMDRVAA